MSETVELKLYSPLQVDVIDRDLSSHAVPLRAVDPAREAEYLDKILSTLQGLQSQEDARNAFIGSDRDWSDICEKIHSCTRSVELVNGRLYGVYSCHSSRELDPEEVDALKEHCQRQWELGWGEGYAHCPSDSPSLGLYIHFWQNDSAPFLTREQLERINASEQSRFTMTEITPDAFWTLIRQAKDIYGQDQRMSAYWLMEQLLALGPEQTLNFHNIMHGYVESAYKFGLWNAATLMQEDGCYADGFMDFRAWLIAQGKETYLAALKDPDSLADVSVYGNCRFESLLYVGDMAHERLTGHMIEDDINSDTHKQLIAELQKDIVYGVGIEYPYEWTEVAAYLPRLCAAHTTPEELRACARRGHLWSHSNPEIQKARAATPKKKKSRNKGGDVR